jgi:NodT family efflux transporter outer membrane factor (OMF) lipoprotein
LYLAEARERVNESYALLGVTRADLYPQADLDASATYSETGEDAVAFRGPPPGEEAEIYSLGGMAYWEIDLWGRTRHLTDAAVRELQATDASLRQLKVSLLAELSLTYFEMRALEERIAVLQRNVELLERSLALAKKRFEAGNGTRLAVAQSQRLLSRTRGELPLRREALAAVRHRIATLLGEVPGRIDLEPGSLPLPPRSLRMGLPASLLERRPDIREAERRYAAAVARIGAAEAEAYPRLSLSGSLDLQADDAGDLFSTEALVYSLGPDLHFPLFTAGRIESQIEVSESRAKQARYRLEQTILRALREVEDAATAATQSQLRRQRLNEAVTAAMRSVTLSEDLYRSGLADQLDVIDARREQIELEEQVVIARQRELASMVQLYRSLGGGWEHSTASSKHTDFIRRTKEAE